MRFTVKEIIRLAVFDARYNRSERLQTYKWALMRLDYQNRMFNKGVN